MKAWKNSGYFVFHMLNIFCELFQHMQDKEVSIKTILFMDEKLIIPVLD